MKSGVITEVHLNFDSSEIYISEAQVPVLSFKFHHFSFLPSGGVLLLFLVIYMHPLLVANISTKLNVD